MADIHGLNPGDYGYDPSQEQIETYDMGNGQMGQRYKGGRDPVTTAKYDAAQPGQTGYDPRYAPPTADQWGKSASESLSGQKHSGNATGFGNAVADVSNFAKDRWGDIMGTRNPNQITVGNAGQNAQGLGDTRSMQMSLIQQLQDQANGVGPSLAQMQLQKGSEQNMANAMALGQSQRGAGQAGMLKGIQGQQAGIAQGMAGDAAMLRLQEQMGARNQLGQSLGQVRGADESMINSNAQRQADAAKQQATLDLEREKMLNEQRKNNSPLGFMGGVFSSMSDERVKTDIAPASTKLYEFLDKLGSHEYAYKDPKHGEGRRISPMAQELESSDAGKEFVFETKDGKAVDYGKGFGTMLASQAALHKRLKALEGK